MILRFLLVTFAALSCAAVAQVGGPRTLAETRTSFPALKIDLTPDELRWLNLETNGPPK